MGLFDIIGAMSGGKSEDGEMGMGDIMTQMPIVMEKLLAIPEKIIELEKKIDTQALLIERLIYYATIDHEHDLNGEEKYATEANTDIGA